MPNINNDDEKDYCIRDILSEVRPCLQAVVAGNKKMVMENDSFKVTCYQMGSIENIRIDIKAKNSKTLDMWGRWSLEVELGLLSCCSKKVGV